MKIFITGGHGFVGKHLSNYLQKLGHKVTNPTSKECDLLKENSLLQYKEEKYDLIFHLAAYIQAGDFPQKNPADIWINNQIINSNILVFLLKHQTQAKFIFLGTSCAYAPGDNLQEKDYMWNKPHTSLTSYAMVKRMLYQGALSLNEQYGLSYLCIVPSTLYGTGYHTDGRQMHFIFDLIRKIIRGKEYGEPVILWGDGYQKRELVFINDFIHILWTLTKNVNNDIFNVGSGESLPIRTFAQYICEIIGYDSNAIQYDTSRYVGAILKCLNIEKVKSILPYQLTSLKKGLTETIKWFYATKSY